jgi:hypothetical protein
MNKIARRTTVRQLIVLNRACDKPICAPDIVDLYAASTVVLAELFKAGLLKRAGSEKVRGGKKVYYRTTVAGERVVIENEKLLEEMFYPAQ